MTKSLNDIRWARRLKLKHLEVMLVLCRLRSVTGAAKELNMTQPAVSHWLADLEEVLATPLFVRGRQMRTTPAGDVLRVHAERMLGDVRRTHEELAAIANGFSGQLHVGTILSAAPALLPRAIARVRAGNPLIHFYVFEATFEILLERLARRELDLIIGPLDVRAHNSSFDSELLIDDIVAVVASPGLAFARKRKPSWKEAATLPWIMPPGGTLMRRQLESAFMAANVAVPTPKIETASITVMQMLLRQDTYLAALAGSVASIYSRLGLSDPVALSPGVSFGPIGMLWHAHEPDGKLDLLKLALSQEGRTLRMPPSKH